MKSVICTECDHSLAPRCEHEERRIERMVEEILSSEQREYHLNDAGLKLYSRGVSVPNYSHNIPLSFSMHIGGDQTSHYPRFVAYVNLQLLETGLRNVQAHLGADMPAALASEL